MAFFIDTYFFFLGSIFTWLGYLEMRDEAFRAGSCFHSIYFFFLRVIPANAAQRFSLLLDSGWSRPCLKQQ